MAENKADAAIVNLKRKIVAVNKLVTHKSKTDEHIAELKQMCGQRDKQLEGKAEEIAKLKAELCQSLLSSGGDNRSSEEVESLKKKLEDSAKLLESKSNLFSGLKAENATKNKKIEALEADLVKTKNKEVAYEKELRKKNDDIIKREMDSQALKQQIEDLQREKKRLEDSIQSGQHVEDIKASYEDAKWKNLGEISRLKQDNARLDKANQELTVSNVDLKKHKTELEKQVNNHVKQTKLNESFERTIEKKEKIIASLEKKLASALDDNKKLKLKAKNKGGVAEETVDANPSQEVGSILEDTNINFSLNNDENTQNEIQEYDSKPHSAPRLSFSFSRPNSRFSIARPKPPSKTAFKLSFLKKASTVENIPEMFNRQPKISDHYTSLTSPPSSAVLGKRKPGDSDLSPSSSSKRLKTDVLGTSLLSPPQHSSTMMFPTQPLPFPLADTNAAVSPKTQTPGRKRKTAPAPPQHQPQPKQPPPRPPAEAVTTSSSLAAPDPVEGATFTAPNPVKTRTAHTKAGPSSSLSSQLAAVPKFSPTKKQKKKANPLSKIVSQPPHLLSPIKSPKVSIPASTTSSPASSSTPPSGGSARDKIKAASLAPVKVDAPVVVPGGKLNPAQLEAAKKRAAVPSGAAISAPSVDGFRQSAKAGGAAAKTAAKAEKKPGKVSEDLLFCPTRKRTNPAKASKSPVPKPENVAKNSGSLKITSKEFVSTEEDSDDEDMNEETASAAKESPAEKLKTEEKADSSQRKTSPVEAALFGDDGDVEMEVNTETLNDDLSVSDSDGDEADEDIRPTKKKEYIESDDEEDSKERFSKLKSEKEPEVESRPRFDVNSSSTTVMETETCVGQPPGPQQKFGTLLEEVMAGFKQRAEQNFAKLKAERERLSQARGEMLYDARVDCLRKHFRNLMGSQNEESFGKLVASVAAGTNPQNETMICDLVYEYLRAEHKDTKLLNDGGEGPAITRKQQRLFSLLTALSEQQRYSGILERMLLLLWHNMFGRDRMYNLKLNAVQNCARMFVLCARHCDNLQLMRCFVYDLFYFKSPRNHVLVGVVMALWPEVFPESGTEAAQSPVMATVAWCVFNTGPEVFSPEMMVEETKATFEKDYGYKVSQP